MGPANSNGPTPGTKKNAEPNNKPQKPAPERAQFAPVFHAVFGIVVTDDIFIGVIVAADDG